MNINLVRKKAYQLNLIKEDSDLLYSTRKGKKYMIRSIKSSKPNNYIHFGAEGMSDFTIHKDEERRQRFISRFKNNKGYNNPDSGLYYSRYLLW